MRSEGLRIETLDRRSCWRLHRLLHTLHTTHSTFAHSYDTHPSRPLLLVPDPTYVCCTTVIISLATTWNVLLAQPSARSVVPASLISLPRLTRSVRLNARTICVRNCIFPDPHLQPPRRTSERPVPIGVNLHLRIRLGPRRRQAEVRPVRNPRIFLPRRTHANVSISVQARAWGAGAATRTEPTFMRIVCTGGTGPECVPAALDEVEAPRGRAVSMGMQVMIMIRADADERRGEIRRNRSVRFRMTRSIAGPGRTFTRTQIGRAHV